MNARQLEKLGVPLECVAVAITTIQNVIREKGFRGKDVKETIAKLVENPQAFLADEHWGAFAQGLLDYQSDMQDVPSEPLKYPTWGQDIDDAAHHQMQTACMLPIARAGALMPDAHMGYGLPIGGVLAVENAVIPYAVGVDIACRMKLSILDIEPSEMTKNPTRFESALQRGTRFGMGAAHETPQDHPVMDQDWNVTRTTREKKDNARKQLGTSGSGNHFVEFGTLKLTQMDRNIGLEPGLYTALLSHSGSRGTGASVCSVYSNIARSQLPKSLSTRFGYLGWLSLDSEAGQEYWNAMNLMGDYAAANHDVIHRLVSKFLGGRVIAGVENHHNFAWKEVHNGKELIVHRKGATPAGKGVLGVIPGSMATPGFVVRGRRMSRTAARQQYTWNSVRNALSDQGVRVISAGADEAPGAYKDIHSVMAAQTDLVEIIGQFDPLIVKMCEDGSPAED
jgi:tRNA-splicing ligase RtcB